MVLYCQPDTRRLPSKSLLLEYLGKLSRVNHFLDTSIVSTKFRIENAIVTFRYELIPLIFTIHSTVKAILGF
jgi:hypothetical protein